MLVVVGAKRRSGYSLRQARGSMVIQALIPEASVEALDERVLRGFAGLDQLELNAMLAGPLVKPLPVNLALVGSNGLGVAPETSRLIEDASRNVLKFRSRPRDRWPPC
jgi:hypothetical protein